MDERQRAENEIKFAQKHLENAEIQLEKAKEQFAAMDETYSVGDRFYEERYGKMILVNVCGKLVFIGLKDGDFYGSHNVNAHNNTKISQKEFERARDGLCLTRYWDSQKKIKT